MGDYLATSIIIRIFVLLVGEPETGWQSLVVWSVDSHVRGRVRPLQPTL